MDFSLVLGILIDSFVAQLNPSRIDIEIPQHRFVEWSTREEDVQTVLYRLRN
jgi:hypothetical protein